MVAKQGLNVSKRNRSLCVYIFSICTCILIFGLLTQMEDDLDEPMEVSSDAHISTTVQSDDSSSARSRKRKARVDPIIEGITNAATLLGKEIQQVSASMNQALQVEVELQKKTSMVSSEISKIQSMSVLDRFKASRKIMCEPEAVLTFWNLEGEERETFVKFMLEE